MIGWRMPERKGQGNEDKLGREVGNGDGKVGESIMKFSQSNKQINKYTNKQRKQLTIQQTNKQTQNQASKKTRLRT